MNKHFKHESKAAKLRILESVLLHPEDYESHEILAPIAQEFLNHKKAEKRAEQQLSESAKPYRVYGKQFIDQNTLDQMDLAMRLPVAVQGALMPDAHVGYGMPIGGVLATENSVIPYGVGLDIGCRMSLSVFDVPATYIDRYSYQIKVALEEQTHFGIGKVQGELTDHEVLDRPEFKETELLRQLHGKARHQIGTSGSGNHFVEVGSIQLDSDNKFGLEAGEYMGLLSHSGSRGFGATIANYYTQVAMDLCLLPKGAQHLAWLDLNSEAGHEYWIAMNLAGDYAKGCHDVIRWKMSKALGLKPHAVVENHHNFAWKEVQSDGSELVVHRKGATPAQEGVMGIIPASMSEPGYVVSGKGISEALQSASHGAGRKMSRRKAKASITGSEVKKILRQKGITLIGGGIDEAPMAYKNLDDVMSGQKELIEIEGTFYPKIVRMDKG